MSAVSAPTRSTGGQVALWIAIIAVAALPVALLVYYLNKGVRDLLQGPVQNAVKAVGAAFTRTGQVLDQEAMQWGYDSSRSELEPRLQYDQQRAQYAKEHGYQYQQASNPPGWPTFEQWQEGVQPTI